MICARCSRPIAPGDGQRIDIDGGSGPGGTVRVHKPAPYDGTLCKRPTPPRTYSLPRN